MCQVMDETLSQIVYHIFSCILLSCSSSINIKHQRSKIHSDSLTFTNKRYRTPLDVREKKRKEMGQQTN